MNDMKMYWNFRFIKGVFPNYHILKPSVSSQETPLWRRRQAFVACTYLMECFVTHRALVRLFHTVGELVVLVVALLVKPFAAVFARVRLVSSVYPRVRVQCWAPVKRFAANGARVRFLLRVYDLVTAQRGRLSESFATYLENCQKKKIRCERGRWYNAKINYDVTRTSFSI